MSKMNPKTYPMMDKTTRGKENTFWNIVKKTGKKAVLTLYGDIVPETPYDWVSGEKVEEGLYVSMEEFMEEVDTLKDCTHLTIRINSGGGDVFTAMAIRSYLEELPATKEVIIDGLAASAASFIGLIEGARIKIKPGAMIMIHEPATCLYGDFDKETVHKVDSSLAKIQDSIITLYENKTQQSREQLSAWMREETWFTAEEALSYGWVDEIMTGNLVDLNFSKEEEVLISNGLRFSASLFRNIPKEMNQRKKEKNMKRKNTNAASSLLNKIGRSQNSKKRATKNSRKSRRTLQNHKRISAARKIKIQNIVEVLTENPAIQEALDEDPALLEEIETALLEAEPTTAEELSEEYPELVEEAVAEELPTTLEELEAIAPEIVEEILTEAGAEELIPESPEELEELDPDLYDEILEIGAEEERDRLEGIDEVAPTITDHALLTRAKYGNANERMNSADLAQVWLAKSTGRTYRNERRKEHKNSNAGRVKGEPNTGNRDSKPAAASNIAKYMKQK